MFGKLLHCSIEHPDWEVTRDKMAPSRFRRTLLKTGFPLLNFVHRVPHYKFHRASRIT